MMVRGRRFLRMERRFLPIVCSVWTSRISRRDLRNWKERTRLRFRRRWWRRYATPMRIAATLLCATRWLAVSPIVRRHWRFRLKRHHAILAWWLPVSWRFRPVSLTIMSASLTIRTSWFALIALLLALTTGVATSLRTVAEISFPSFGIRAVNVILIV